MQTGVKSFGCENRIAQPSPIHSWKLMAPWVVSAVKSGASSLMRKLMIGGRLLAWPIKGKLIFKFRRRLINKPAGGNNLYHCHSLWYSQTQSGQGRLSPLFLDDGVSKAWWFPRWSTLQRRNRARGGGENYHKDTESTEFGPE